YGPQNDVTLKMPAFEWVHVQLHQQKGMISLSPPTICNSAEAARARGRRGGRPLAMSDEDARKARAMLSDVEITKAEVAKHFGVSRPTLNAALARLSPSDT
uniref:helix-turn-helix domain-containing protein n=2 Tax=Escherichia coli TaxID=562 RepID=UPI00197EB1A0